MDALYHQTNKLVQETQHLFSQLDKKISNLNEDEIDAAIQSKIQLINSNCERLEVLCSKGPISQRQTAKMRVDQLKYDNRHLNAALNSWKNKKLKEKMKEAEREALLSRTFTTNDHVDILMDHGIQHNNRLQNATYGMDNLLQHGADILDSLRSQRYTLKGAHRRLVDIGNTLGLSNTTMRFIEQRTRQDGFILIVGMVFTVVIIILVIVYFI